MTTDPLNNPALQDDCVPPVRRSGSEHSRGDGESAFSELDVRFGRFMERLSGHPSRPLFLAAALASRSRSEGHVCVDLAALADTPLDGCIGEDLHLPELAPWLNALRAAPVVGAPGAYRPLILTGSRLYLCRDWEHENTLANLLRSRTGLAEDVNFTRLRGGLARLFPPDPDEDAVWPKVAAWNAVSRRLCIISGGPGTGKTWAVARILALLLEQHGEKPLRIALCAPTGKAAARLSDAIQKAREGLDCSDAVKAAMPQDSSTLHRLLGSMAKNPAFRYNAGRPLPFDAVVVDEASMVDLALFSRLLQALPTHARLILLGDKDQLASVEAGAVLGDICDTGHVHPYSQDFIDRCAEDTGHRLSTEPPAEGGGMADAIVTLRRSYRFGRQSGIRALSLAVNEGLQEEALAVLTGQEYADTSWHDLPRPDALAKGLETRIIEQYGPCMKTVEPAEAFRLFNRFRILCALRRGPYGTRAINETVEQLLARAGLIGVTTPWYVGRPVMITKNDYNLRLFNGDVGIVLPDPSMGHELRVFFPADGKTFRSLPPSRLPEHETVFAMTVHKSQGSEFDEILLILSDRDSPLLTRELVYTGITRAKETVGIWASEEAFRKAVVRRTERMSGLRDALWQTTP